MFLVKCPKCKHEMKYMPSSDALKGKKKRCVYCGYSFSVHPSNEKSNIVKKI